MFWRAPILDGFNFNDIHLDAVFANYQIQVFCLGDMELAFIDVSLYAKFLKLSKHIAHMLLVLSQILTINQDIVQVRGTKPI